MPLKSYEFRFTRNNGDSSLDEFFLNSLNGDPILFTGILQSFAITNPLNSRGELLSDRFRTSLTMTYAIFRRLDNYKVVSGGIFDDTALGKMPLIATRESTGADQVGAAEKRQVYLITDSLNLVVSGLTYDQAIIPCKLVMIEGETNDQLLARTGVVG